MKLKIWLSIACIFMLSLQVVAQRTLTNKWSNGRISEQYTINANGDYHGTFKAFDTQGRLIGKLNYLNGDLHGICVAYFNNGTVNEQATYYKGIRTSLKVYSYNENGTKRTLVRDATWDKKGRLLTNTSTVNGVTAGKLPNGYWSTDYYMPYHIGRYIERYNGNDTIYLWYDKSKKTFEGKEINGVFIESEELIKDREDRYKLAELALANKQAKEDSIIQARRANYDTEVANIKITDTIYKKFITDVMDGSEHKFYSIICNHLKHSNSDTLRTMIMKTLGITMDDLLNTNINITSELSPNK